MSEGKGKKKTSSGKTSAISGKSAKRGKPFEKGQSGNPSGRPKLPPEIKEAARAASPEALRVLITIMKSADSPEASRIRAAEIIMNRAYGTPEVYQHIIAEDDEPLVINFLVDAAQ